MPYVDRVEPGSEQSPPNPSEQWPREVGPRGWTPAPLPPAQRGGVEPRSRARTGLIIVAALVTELIIIAAADNQWVSKKIVRNEMRTNSRILHALADSWLTFTWRGAPQSGTDGASIWASELALIGTVLVISALLILAVTRGPITFGRAFFGTWMAVFAATQLGAFVRALISPQSRLMMPESSRLTRAVFSGLGPSQYTVAAGFTLGLVVALIAAIVAVATRRPAAPVAESEAADQPPPYQQPEQPVPYYGDRPDQPQPSPPAWSEPPNAPPWSEPPSAPSGAGPASDDTSATTQLPPLGGEDATTRYRPIDEDDDLGHGPEQH